MNTPAYRLKKDSRTGIYAVVIETPNGCRTLTTGERSWKRAVEVCDEAMVAKLLMASKAGVLNANAISVLTTGRKFTCADVSNAWREEAAIDLAPDTLNTYSLAIAQFIDHAGVATKPVAMVARQTLDSFVNAKDASLAQRRARLSALRSFFGFANAAAYCTGNLADRIRVRQRDLMFGQIERGCVLPITREEYETVMASEKATGFYRWATALSYWLGLRLRDVACLEWASLQDLFVIVHTKKRGVRVALPLDNPLLGSGDLKAIIAEMREMPDKDPVFCFPDQRDIVLSTTRRAYLSMGYTRILARLGIEDRSFHSLRHSFAQRLDAADVTIEEIGELIGHADTATTQIYLSASRPKPACHFA